MHHTLGKRNILVDVIVHGAKNRYDANHTMDLQTMYICFTRTYVITTQDYCGLEDRRGKSRMMMR